MKTKDEIVSNWLPRYTETPLDAFGQHILLTNFFSYVDQFARTENAEIRGLARPMQTATSADGITIVNFGMGSPNAATVCDLLSAVHPKAILLLGKCGGLKHKVQVGDFILPIAAIRAEGTSDSYYPREVPALPSFQLQKAVSHTIVANEQDYYTGTIYTTNRRVWEHDEEFKSYLHRTRCIGIDMETATLFIAAFANQIPHGALLLVSDLPLTEEGIKTDISDTAVTERYAGLHLKIGVESLRELKSSGISVKHLVFQLRANAGKSHVDPDRIGVMGTSAGGCLAAMIGTSGGVAAMEGSLGNDREVRSRVACVVDQFGPTDAWALYGGNNHCPNTPEAKQIGGPLGDHYSKQSI